VKRTISARADGAVCIGRQAIPVGVSLITVPHNITLFVKFKITIVPESICGLFIDQMSKVLPVVVIPLSVLALPSLCDSYIFVFSLAFKSEIAQSLGVIAPLPLGSSSVSLAASQLRCVYALPSGAGS